MSAASHLAGLADDRRDTLANQSKRAAAYKAVKDHLSPHFTRIGIGSGSTVVYVAEAIAALGGAVTSNMVFYPTGTQSEELIEGAGLTMRHINKLPPGQLLDVVFDGADEVDDELNLIKGGGACLWQEKLVVTSARKFVCVADFRKLSPRLGTRWTKGIPIEVLPMAAPRVLDELRGMGAPGARVRSGLPAKTGPMVTDNGMWIIDAPFSPLLLPGDDKPGTGQGASSHGAEEVAGSIQDVSGPWTVEALADRLRKMVGVAEVGLFTGKNGLQALTGAQKPVAAYFGMEDGTVERRPR